MEVARTTMGAIGCKVWINRGIILTPGLNNQITPVANKPFERREHRPFNNNRKENK
jgi:ribosomal protein S3